MNLQDTISSLKSDLQTATSQYRNTAGNTSLNVIYENENSIQQLNIQDKQEREKKQMQRLIDLMTTRIKSFETKTAENEGIQTALRRTISELQEQIKESRQKINDLKQEIEVNNNTNNNNNNHNNSFAIDLNKSRSEIVAKANAAIEIESHLATIENLKSDIKQLQSTLKDEEIISKKQKRVMEEIVKELVEVETLVRQPWFLRNSSNSSSASASSSRKGKFPASSLKKSNISFSEDNLTEILEKELIKNDEKAKKFLQYDNHNHSYNYNHSYSNIYNRSNKSFDNSRIHFQSPEISGIETRIYVALGELRSQLGIRAREALENSKSLNSEANSLSHKSTQRGNDATTTTTETINELQRVMDSKVEFYEDQHKRINKELQDIKAKYQVYKDEYYSCKAGYDKAKIKLEKLEQELESSHKNINNQKDQSFAVTSSTSLDNTQQHLKIQLNETKIELKKYQEKAAEYKRKLTETEKLKNDREQHYAQKLLKFVEKVELDRQKVHEEHVEELNAAVEKVKKKMQKKLDNVLKHQQQQQQPNKEILLEVSSNNNNKQLQLNSSKEQQLTIIIKTLIAHSKHLRARIDRETALRADLAFMKRFFMMRIASYQIHNMTTLEVLQSMGIVVNHEQLKRERELEAAEKERVKREILGLLAHATSSSSSSFFPLSSFGTGFYSSILNNNNNNLIGTQQRKIEELVNDKEIMTDYKKKQETLNMLNFLSAKRKLFKAVYAIMAIQRLKKRVEERKEYEVARNQVRIMIKGLVQVPSSSSSSS